MLLAELPKVSFIKQSANCGVQQESETARVDHVGDEVHLNLVPTFAYIYSYIELVV